MNLHEHSDDELISTARRLIGTERKLTARFVEYLAEIEERRLHLIAGYSSMFDFCTRALGLSENEAFRRIAAARLGRRFPVVQALLISGAVHLSTLELVREHLTDENHRELLEVVSGRSKREVEAVLAARFPRPDAPARIRQLSEERFKIEFTAPAELRDKLERCRDLMSHANPRRDLVLVIERAVDLLLDELERSRLKRTARPRSVPPRPDDSHARPRDSRAPIPNATRREVLTRDGFRCTYVSPDGRRCEARAFLELDHQHPRALGGDGSAENLRVLCRAHNQLAAEQAFGRGALVRARHLGRTKSDSIMERVHSALTGMGFKPTCARQAIAEVQRLHPTELPSLEHALREAILVATRIGEHPRRVA